MTFDIAKLTINDEAARRDDQTSLTLGALGMGEVSKRQLESLANDLKYAEKWRDQIAHALKPMAGLGAAPPVFSDALNGRLQSIVKEFHAVSSWSKVLDGQAKYFRDAVGPLANLRDATLFQIDRSLAMDLAKNSLAFQPQAQKWFDQQTAMSATVLNAFKGIESVASQLFETINPTTLSAIQNSSLKYAGVAEILSRESHQIKGLSQLMEDMSWVKQLNLPVIDIASASAIAKAWDMDGLMSQVRSLGLDQAAWQALAESIERPDLAEELSFQEREPKLPARGLSMEMWLSILGVLLGVLVPIWQKIDSDAAEAHLISEMKSIEERNAQRMQALSMILEAMVEQSAKDRMRQVSYVAKERVALIRNAGRPGSKIVAEVFPNQVVELVSENGKWIEVRYFDWVAREERDGWTLRKYFIRVQTAKQ